MIIYLRLERAQVQREADVAQVVAHLIGSEEVTGPSPVISSLENSLEIAVLFDKYRVFRDFYVVNTMVEMMYITPEKYKISHDVLIIITLFRKTQNG